MRPGSGFDSGTPNRIAKNTRVTAIAGTMRVRLHVPAERREDAPAAEGADDRTGLEGDHEVSGRAAGLRCAACRSRGRGRR